MSETEKRMMRCVLVVGWVAGAVLACSGAAPRLVSQSRPVPPSRNVRLAYDQGDRRYYSYWGFGARSAEEAHALAFDNILTRQIPVELGVEVSGATAVHEVEKDGSYSYRFERVGTVKSSPVRFEGIRVEDRYEECFRQSGDIVCNGYVLASIPHEELARVKVALSGRTVLQLSCDSGTCCDGGTEERLRAAAAKAAFPLIDRTERGEGDVDQVCASGGAAQVLKVQLRGREVGKAEGAWFAVGSGSARLVDCLTGKVRAELDVPESKQGEYGRQQALCLAVRSAADRLSSRIEAGLLSPEEEE